jgi:dGTPase
MQLLVHGFGLNVTAATLSAACKYTAPSHKAESRSLIHELTKPGYFASEQDLLARVRSLTGTADCRHPITYLVEAADDIVYSTVDLEDGVKKRVLDWSEVLEQIRLACGSAPIFSRCEAQVQAHVGRADLHGDALAETLATAFRIAAISELVPACVKTFEKRYGDIMDGQYHDQLILDPDSEATPLIQSLQEGPS